MTGCDVDVRRLGKLVPTPKASPARVDVWCAVEEKAVAWLAAHRARFDPAAASTDDVIFIRKALLELALFIGLRVRLDPQPVQNDYADLLSLVVDVAARASYRELAPRDDRALLLYAGTYAALRLCGQEDLQFRHILTKMVHNRYATCFERIPYRQLDLFHTLELAGLAVDSQMVDKVLPFTLLCGRPSTVLLKDGDIYAITHSVFYATDFGRRVPTWPDGFGQTDAVRLVNALIPLCMQQRNADLVAEVLCCLACLGVPDCETAQRGWAFLLDQQNLDGRVRGPSGIVHPDQGKGDVEYRRWATSYHTTIVVALAALLSRNSDRSFARRGIEYWPGKTRPEDISEGMKSAITWVVDRVRSSEDLSGAVTAVAAAHRAAAAIGKFNIVRGAVQSTIERINKETKYSWMEHGADVALEIAFASLTCDISCPSLHMFLSDTAAVLLNTKVVPNDSISSVRRLVKLGFLNPVHGNWLTDDTDPLSDLSSDPLVAAQELVCRSDNATIRIDVDDLRAKLAGDRLIVALPQACQSYELERVALLLRALAILCRQDDLVVNDAIRFLLAQQATTGAFGYAAMDDPLEGQKVQQFWTLNCVIALTAIVETWTDR